MPEARVDAKNLGLIIKSLKTKIKTAITDGVARAYRDGISISLSKMSVTNRMIDDWKRFGRVKTGSVKMNRLIGVFSNGEAAKLNQSGGHAMFMDFDNNPGLEEWASVVNPKLLLKDGMWVGRQPNTRWGKPANQWLTNGKTESLFLSKMYGVEELMKIKKL